MCYYLLKNAQEMYGFVPRMYVDFIYYAVRYIPIYLILILY